VEEVTNDIQAMKNIADQIVALSCSLGERGLINRTVLKQIYNNDFRYNEYFQTVAVWLYYGGENVFLQDANSLIMKTDDLVTILNFLREKFPHIKRITSYCRSHTAARKSVAELNNLHSAGLSRIHIGMESGSDEVLALIHKGVTAKDHIRAGLNIKEASIELSEYVMPGLGGAEFTKEHALETARVINAINPDFVRLRTLHVVPGTALSELVERREFQPIGDEAILREIRLLIENLDLQNTYLSSDHILNLLEEVEGKLPEAKKEILAVIDKYFSLGAKDRLIYRLGRRTGALRKLDDLADQAKYLRLKSVVDSYESDQNKLEEDISKIMSNYI
jgi:radical SAM superfamily enzyme YgiQ (UPF0313 family)